MAIVCSVTHSTDLFTWSPETRTFVAEASDFGNAQPAGTVYDDACDEGFWLVSSKTSKKELCVYDGPRYDNENEIISWVYRHYDILGRKRLEDWSVIVYND